MTDDTNVWLTQAGFDALVAELEQRSGPIDAEITARIAAAREEGDLRENGGYHAAREEKAKNEGRILELKSLIERAHVGEPPNVEDGVVTHGAVVTVAYSDGDEVRFLLASREQAAATDLDVFSPTSPLGQAVIDKKVGEQVSYELPNGRSTAVTIVKVEPYSE